MTTVDSYPLRFQFKDGQWVLAEPFPLNAKPNPAYRCVVPWYVRMKWWLWNIVNSL